MKKNTHSKSRSAPSTDAAVVKRRRKMTTAPPLVARPGTVPLNEPIRLTKWTAPMPVTKRLRLATDGTVKKVSTAAHLYKGGITRLTCSPAEFIKTLASIGPNDCGHSGTPSQIVEIPCIAQGGAPRATHVTPERGGGRAFVLAFDEFVTEQ